MEGRLGVEWEIMDNGLAIALLLDRQIDSYLQQVAQAGYKCMKGGQTVY